MLYDDQKLPEIHTNLSVHQEIEDESVVLPVERCQEGPEVGSIEAVLKKEKVSDKNEINWKEIPTSLCAAEASSWSSDEVDFRPHLLDAASGQFLLVDSGSQCTAWPPDPGDKEDPSMFLKAVNNTKMK